MQTNKQKREGGGIRDLAYVHCTDTYLMYIYIGFGNRIVPF